MGHDREVFWTLKALSVGLAFLLGLASSSSAQPVITTLVGGNGVVSYSGDGGPASLAGLACPDDVAMDPNGHLYIADACSNTVRRVDALTGIITTYAGRFTGIDMGGYSGDGGAANQALLFYPSGVACDAVGNLYIADYYNCVIRKVTAATGIITTVVGDGNCGYAGDGGPATSGRLNNPTMIHVDPLGNLFVSDTGNNVIRKVDVLTGVLTTVAGYYPGGAGYAGDGGLATAALLDGCEAMVMAPSGDLYISDKNNNVIRKVSGTSGIITTVVGNGTRGYAGDGGLATMASLYFDNGTMTLDGDGNLFFTDDVNNVIRRVDAVTGIITTVAGQGPPVPVGYEGDGGPPLSARFNHTESLCFVGDCDLLVADYGNNAIRRITGMGASCPPTPTPTPSATPSATASPSPTASGTPTPTFTPTVTTTPSPRWTETPPDRFYVSRNVLPANGEDDPVRIRIDLSTPERVSLKIYNTAGELIRILQDVETPVHGLHEEWGWDGRNKFGEKVASGVYLIRYSNSARSVTARVLVVR